MRTILYIIFLLSSIHVAMAQMVPSKVENIAYLVTFGKEAAAKWGDDDHVQSNFFSVPGSYTGPIFIRIYDADCGGKEDQQNTAFNSKTKFSIYGGKGCYSNKDARSINPIGNFKSGNLLATKTLGVDETADGNWISFGPFDPKDGEFDEDLKANVFKIIAEGISGDDGNLYRYFMSTSENQNLGVPGGNAFYYELTYRLTNSPGSKAHFYPFIDKYTIAVKQYNFDFDSDGFIRMNSIAKKLQSCNMSNDAKWSYSIAKIVEEEKNTSIDIEFIKKSNKPNDMTFYILNQYDEAVPFFASPIGGLPKYKYKIGVQTTIETQ
jgi:hypothetical protein